jgi:superfamily I DNA/RNA helicase
MERGVPPDRIGFMTFTKRGVEEAISRAADRFNLPRARFRFFNTLHSAAFRHLGLNSDQVFTGSKIREFGEAYGLDLHGGLSSDDGTYSNFYGDDLILFLENFARITRIPMEEVLHKNDYIVPDFERAYKIIKHFRQYKTEQGLFDFTDMIEQFILSDDPPYLEVLIIDESQDLSELQWEMVFLLTRHVKRIYIAGDDDQTIFTWAGASERFISMEGRVHILKQSYRVPVKIHSLANRVINKVQNRRPKVWNPRAAEGTVSSLENMSELDFNMLHETGSVMMLGRTVKLIRTRFVPLCRHYGLPYRYFENNGVKVTQARAIEAWNDLYAGNKVPAPEVLSVYGLLPSEGHGKKPGIAHGHKVRLKRIAEQEEPPSFTMAELRREYGLLAEGKWNEVFTEIDPKDVDYIQKVLNNGFSLLDKPKIHISTIHRVKGGQADTVVLLSDTAKKSEEFAATNQDEETRVFYTGITRTKNDLILIRPARSRYHGGLFE